jgi:V/A-type H+-transporting ATPase subunit F
MMEIAVVGTPEFTLGFQLAGVTRLHNPTNLEETATVLRSLMSTPEVGIVVIDSSDLTQMPEKTCYHNNLSSQSRPAK